jgi:hypothetical protein
LKSTIAITLALFSLLISLGITFFIIKYKPLGEGIDKYNFSDPLAAYKSTLQMNFNQDVLAQIQLNTAISGKKSREKDQTLKVNKAHEYGGKTILFIEYSEAGLPKKDIVGMEKDAESGLWHEEYIAAYQVEDKNPELAAEIKDWEKK